MFKAMSQDFSIRSRKLNKGEAYPGEKLVKQRLVALGYSDADFDDGIDTSGDSDYTSNIIGSIVNAATSIGTTEILASQAPQAIAPGSYIAGAGNALPTVLNTQAATSKSNTFVIAIVVIILGVFAFMAMGKK